MAARARGTHPSAQSEVSRRGCRGTQTSQTLASRYRIPANFEEPLKPDRSASSWIVTGQLPDGRRFFTKSHLAMTKP